MNDETNKIDRAIDVIATAELTGGIYFSYKYLDDELGSTEEIDTNCACAIGSLVAAVGGEFSENIIPFLFKNNSKSVKQLGRDIDTSAAMFFNGMQDHYGLTFDDVYRVQAVNDGHATYMHNRNKSVIQELLNIKRGKSNEK